MADTKQQWYKDAKYGLFIHWGLYSILAGEWKDPKTGEVTKTDRIAEWIENNLNIDKEDYRKLKDEFHPDKFDADMFVKRAKEQWGVIRQIKRCLFRQIKTGLSEHLTMG